MEGRGIAIPLNTCIYITCNILGVSFWPGVHIMIWLCYSLFSLSCHQKLKSKLFNTERPESWRWKKINTCTNKASPRIRFIQYFIWDALRKMFCPNFKALYRVISKFKWSSQRISPAASRTLFVHVYGDAMLVSLWGAQKLVWCSTKVSIHCLRNSNTLKSHTYFETRNI